MTKTTIIIISVEGIESNTEVYFYKGLSNYYQQDVHVFAIGKSGTSSRDEEIKRILKDRFGEIKVLNEEVFIYFVGDLDKPEQIKSMERALFVFSDELKNNWHFIAKDSKLEILEKIIGDEGKKFEDIFSQFLKTPAFGSMNLEDVKHALIKERNSFNVIGKACNWLNSSTINWETLLKDTKTKTAHYKIFKQISSLDKKIKTKNSK